MRRSSILFPIIAFIFAFLAIFIELRSQHAGRRPPVHGKEPTSSSSTTTEVKNSPGRISRGRLTTTVPQLTCVDSKGFAFHTDPYFAKKFGKACR